MSMSLGVGHPNDRKVTFGGVNTRSGGWVPDRIKDRCSKYLYNGLFLTVVQKCFVKLNNVR